MFILCADSGAAIKTEASDLAQRLASVSVLYQHLILCVCVSVVCAGGQFFFYIISGHKKALGKDEINICQMCR